MKPDYRVLVVQLAIIGFFVFAVANQMANFPYPSPLIRPLLPPKLRWPTQQIMVWVEDGRFDREFSAYFARDPQRAVPPGDNAVSAADGIVQRIDQRGGINYFVVGLSFWDVHVVRTPLSGVVKEIEPAGTWYDKAESGTRTPEQLEQFVFLQGKAAPVQEIVTIGTSVGDVRVRLITSYWASRLKVWVKPGQKLAKGQRLGRILLGSTVVVELPKKLDWTAKIGQHVLGGESIIGSMPR